MLCEVHPDQSRRCHSSMHFEDAGTSIFLGYELSGFDVYLSSPQRPSEERDHSRVRSLWYVRKFECSLYVG